MVTPRIIFDLALAGTIVMVLFAALIMPQFNDAFNPSSCVQTGWANNSLLNNQSSGACWEESERSGGGVVSNASVVTGCSTDYVSCCRTCSDWGFRDTARGLLTLVFALFAVAIGLRFVIPRM